MTDTNKTKSKGMFSEHPVDYKHFTSSCKDLWRSSKDVDSPEECAEVFASKLNLPVEDVYKQVVISLLNDTFKKANAKRYARWVDDRIQMELFPGMEFEVPKVIPGDEEGTWKDVREEKVSLYEIRDKVGVYLDAKRGNRNAVSRALDREDAEIAEVEQYFEKLNEQIAKATAAGMEP